MLLFSWRFSWCEPNQKNTQPERGMEEVFIRPGVFQVGKIAKVEVLDELLGVIGSLAPCTWHWHVSQMDQKVYIIKVSKGAWVEAGQDTLLFGWSLCRTP